MNGIIILAEIALITYLAMEAHKDIQSAPVPETIKNLPGASRPASQSFKDSPLATITRDGLRIPGIEPVKFVPPNLGV